MMQVSGVGGQLLAGGHRPAARLGAWSLRPSDALEDGWEIQVCVHVVDEFWITQGPFRVVLAIGGQEWSWDTVNWDGSSTIHVSGSPREGLVVVKEES